MSDDLLSDLEIKQFPSKDLELTVDQEQLIMDTWNKDPAHPPGILELGQIVFKKECDGRSKEARAIKKCLAKFDLKARPPSTYQPKSDEIELSEAHKLYITNNARSMNAVEMAKEIFHNPALTNVHAETRAVNNYLKTLDTRIIANPQDILEVPDAEYRPPKTIDQCLVRINQYIDYVQKKESLSASQRKEVDMLMGNLHNYRFIALMNTYTSEKERKLCEDAFIRYTYDKPDLTQEEVDEYIILCGEVVMGFDIKHRMEHLKQALDNITISGDEQMKISMSLVEAIGKAQSAHDDCVKRQQKLLDDLKEKRSAKMSKKIKDNASVLNLIQLWKQEDTRQQLLDIAKEEDDKVEKEIDKLTKMADVKARIMGLTKKEARYG